MNIKTAYFITCWSYFITTQSLKDQGVDLPKRQTERDLEEVGGGPGVFSMDLRKNYLLADDDWKYDVIPEIIDGKNIADYIDPDIEERLKELEEEEDLRLEELRELNSARDGEDTFKLNDNSKEALRQVKETVALMRVENAAKKARGRGKLGRVAAAVEAHQELIHKNRDSRSRKREQGLGDFDGRDLSMDDSVRARSQSTIRSTSRTRFFSNAPSTRDRGVVVSKLGGLKSGSQKLKAFRMSVKKTRVLARDSRQGESDRHHFDMKPKWAFSGKMKSQKTRHSR